MRERAADGLPPAMAALRAELADLPAARALTTLEARLGPPTRDEGSGVVLPVWERADGTVRYLVSSGVVFVDRGGRTHWLTRTLTTARANLVRSFEVATLPDPANRGTTTFVGTLDVTADGGSLRYRYTAARPGPPALGDSFFFAAHPAGTMRLAWSAGVGDDTPLGRDGDGDGDGDTVLGTVSFVGDGGSQGAEAELAAEIRSSAAGRTLQLVAPALGATLSAPWRGAWTERMAER